MAQSERDKIRELERALVDLDNRRKYRRIDFFRPYLKQQEFFDMGSTFRERLLSAGNQLGKSEAGAVEMAYHLTGQYPDDWLGRRFNKPIKAWAAGVSATLVRKVQQKKLFGEPGLAEAFGTGFIPKDCLPSVPSASRSAADAYDTAHVVHRTDGKIDGTSTLNFLSYEQGREKFQGDTVDLIWLDEECSEEIYTECLTRTNATRGSTYITFTPLNGKTKLYTKFTDDNDGSRGFIRIRAEDATFKTAAEIEEDMKQYPAYQREARMNGIPLAGEGAIFTTPESALYCDIPLNRVPPHWYKLWSIDFGINVDHQFAAVLQAWDKDTDTMYVLDAYKMPDTTPLQHAVKMKHVGIMVPVAWPHDGGNREKGSGETIASLYKKQGLKMCPEHATFQDGGYSTEAGVLEMVERVQSDRYKVNSHLKAWFDEYRDYHRKDGLIVKKNDDLLSATRIGCMAKRMGRQVMLGSKAPSRNNNPNAGMATDVELSGRDLF